MLTIAQLEDAAPILELEHDPDCRTFEGICYELEDVYDLTSPMAGDEIVTVVFFEPLGEVAA